MVEKIKNPAAVALGRLGGLVKGRKGFATNPAAAKEAARKGVEARRRKKEQKVLDDRNRIRYSGVAEQR